MNEWWPLKAQTPSLPLFVNGLRFSAPNKRLKSGESAPGVASPVWAHREQWSQDLVPWWMLPWQERARAAEGYGSGGSCWSLCVVVVFCYYSFTHVR